MVKSAERVFTGVMVPYTVLILSCLAASGAEAHLPSRSTWAAARGRSDVLARCVSWPAGEGKWSVSAGSPREAPRWQGFTSEE